MSMFAASLVRLQLCFLRPRVTGVLLLALVCGSASAQVLLDVNGALSASDPTQTGRLTRNGVPSDWSAVKNFPGVTNPTFVQNYHAFTIPAATIGAARFVQVMVDDPNGATFTSAYVDSFVPAPAANNRGMDTNYLGDLGSTGNLFISNLGFFQVTVPVGHDLVLAVCDPISNNPGRGKPFRLLVEGFIDNQYTEPPPVITTPPANLTLCEGFSAQFSVVVNGGGQLTYQWRKGTTNLVDAGNVSGSTTATLTLNPVLSTDAAANYNVIATGSGGTVTSANASLTVTPNPAPTLATAPASGQVGTAIPLNLGLAVSHSEIPHVVALQIGNVPSSASLSAGTAVGGGLYTLTPEQLVGLTLTSTDVLSVALDIQATSTPSGNGCGALTVGGKLQVDVAPGFTSAPSAAPVLSPTLVSNAEVTGLAVLFTALASPSDTVVNWDLGDGSPALQGSTVQHTYVADGTYTVTVTASNPRSPATSTASFQVTVAAANHLPGSTKMTSVSGTVKLSATLSTITAKALCSLPAAVKLVGGETLSLSFGGLSEAFMLNSKGKGTQPDGTVSVKVATSKKTGSSLSISPKLKGNLMAKFIAGVTLDANQFPKVVVVQAVFGGTTFSAIVPVTFKKSKTSASASLKFK